MSSLIPSCPRRAWAPILAASLLLPLAARATTPQDAAVWLSFTNTSGTLVNDDSGRGNHGTAAASATIIPGGGPTIPGGPTLGAVDFAGVGNSANSVVINDSATMDFDKTTGTIVFWVKPDTSPTRMAFTKTSPYASTTGIEIEKNSLGMFASPQGFNLAFYCGSTGAGAFSPPVGQWTHVAFTWNASTDVCQFYINGAFMAGSGFGGANTFNATTTGSWYLGWDPDTAVAPRPLDGRMADYAIFGKVLEPFEVFNIYSNSVGGVGGPPPPPPDPVTDLQATTGLVGRVALAWTNPPTAGFAGVLIVRPPTGDPLSESPVPGTAYAPGVALGNGTVVYVGPGTDPTPEAASAFTHTNLPPSTALDYAVFAYDATTNYSSAATAGGLTLPAPPPPLAPEALAGRREITLTWTNPVGDELEAILILRRQNAPPTGSPQHTSFYSTGENLGDGVIAYRGWGSNTNPGEATTWTDTNLPNRVTFHYSLFTADSAPNYSTAAAAGPVTTLAMANITNLNATPLEHGVDFTWDNPAEPELAGVLVLRATSGFPDAPPVDGTAYTLGSALGNATVAYVGPSADPTPAAPSAWNETAFLESDTSHYYAFFAYDISTNYAQPVVELEIVTLLDVTPPGPVDGLAAWASALDQITLIWTNPPNLDFDGVLIVRRAGAPPQSVPVNGTAYLAGDPLDDALVLYAGPASNAAPSADALWLDDELPLGGRFHYQVFAYDSALNYAEGRTADALLNPDADSDDDGHTNAQEDEAGTDPLDPDSVLRFTSMTPMGIYITTVETNQETQEVYTQQVLQADSVIVSWPSESNRVYDLFSGGEVVLATNPLATDLPASPPINVYTAAVDVVPRQYFRITVTPEPF